MNNSGTISLFRTYVDNDARVIGNFRDISIIMRNTQLETTYYVHYIREFWHKFGKFYPQFGGQGISVAKIELEHAIKQSDIETWIIIIMDDRKNNTHRFYGYKAKDWYKFCEQNNTWNDHTAKNGLMNGTIPDKLLKNLFSGNYKITQY